MLSPTRVRLACYNSSDSNRATAIESGRAIDRTLDECEVRMIVSMRKTFVLVIVFLIGASAVLLSAYPVRSNQKSSGEQAPTGTIVPLVLKNLISSKTAYLGEAIYCETIYPVVVNDKILIPAGSYVRGEVTAVEHPGKIKGKASLNIRFMELTLPSGHTLPLSATVYSIAGARLQESKAEAKSDAVSADQAPGTDLAVGGAQDAVIDASGLGSGSAITAASQGVGGLIVMLATRGKTIIMKPGTNFELRLTQPLVVGAPARSSVQKNKEARRNP